MRFSRLVPFYLYPFQSCELYIQIMRVSDILVGYITAYVRVMGRHICTGSPSENPGPWAERSRALSYRALLYRALSYLILTMLTVGPAGPLKVAGPLGICPPCPPLSAGLYMYNISVKTFIPFDASSPMISHFQDFSLFSPVALIDSIVGYHCWVSLRIVGYRWVIYV